MDDTNLNLPFEVVAVPQHVVHTTTSYATPIKVKIKMKKGENNGSARNGVISVSKLKPIYPEVTRRVRSDETIMSFNIRMEPENESRPRRKSQNKFFHIFKTGICLDTEDEDENEPPYMLASSDKSSETKPQQLSHGKKEKNSINTSTNKSKSPDVLFGKCKPGGCLDPPFGEDKYQYYRPVKLKQLKGTEVENLQKPCSENADNDKREKRIAEISVKSTDNKESDASSTHMIYKVGSKNDELDDKYSDSIITYPTRTSSRDLSSLERSVISKKSSSFKTRQLNHDTYFAPTKLSKSQERKRESVSKRITNPKDDVKKIIKIEVSSCNIPISKHTGDILLDDNVIHLETLQTNPPQLKNQSNHKVSQLVEVSGNILLTVNHILEPTASFKSNHEEIIISETKEVNSNCLDGHNNATEILKPTTADVTGEEIPTLSKLSSSPMEIFENLQILNTTAVKTASTIISNEKQILNENNAENCQIHYAIPKYEKQENQLSHTSIDTNENMSKLVSQQKTVKELPNKYSSHKTKENTSETPQYIVKEVKPQTHDLNVMTVSMPYTEKKVDSNCSVDTIQTNEQLSKYIADVLGNSDIEEVKNGNIKIHDNLNIDSHKESDKLQKSINSNSNNDHINEKNMLGNYYIPEKRNNSNGGSIPNNDIVDKDNEIQTTKGAKSIADVNTTNDKEKVIKDNSLSNILLSNAVNTSTDFAVAKNNITLSFDDTRQESNENLLRYNDLITTENASKTSNNIQLNQFQEKERSLTYENILDNLPPEKESIVIEDTLPAIFSTTKYTNTISNTEISGNNNTTDNNIKTSGTNEIHENGITHKQDSTKAVIKTETDDSLPSKDIVPQDRQYALLDITSTSVIAGDKSYDNIVSENISEPAKDTISYHDNNDNEEVYNTISTQNTLSRNKNFYDLESQPTNITKRDISNKSSLIESTKYLEINNDLDIPYNTTSKENLSTRSGKSFLDDNSIKPPLSTVISVNTITSNDVYLSSTTNATGKDGLGEIRQTPDNRYYNKTIDSKYHNKYEEWVPSNGAKRMKSKYAFEPPGNNTTIVELGFHTYIDENGDTLLKTFDVHQEPQRFTQDSIFVTRKVLEINDSNLSFSINSDTRLSLKIDNSTKASKRRYFKEEVSPGDTTQRIYKNNKMRYHASDIGTLQESLSAVYENELIPIEQLIRSLRLEIDRIIQYNHLLRKKSVTTIKKLKPTYSKRCVCIRKWNN